MVSHATRLFNRFFHIEGGNLTSAIQESWTASISYRFMSTSQKIRIIFFRRALRVLAFQKLTGIIIGLAISHLWDARLDCSILKAGSCKPEQECCFRGKDQVESETLVSIEVKVLNLIKITGIFKSVHLTSSEGIASAPKYVRSENNFI